MMQKSGLRNILVIFIVLNVLALGVYGYLFYSIKATIENTSQLEANLALEKENDNNFRNTKDALENIEERAQILETTVLTEEGIITFLQKIEDIAASQNILISTEIKKTEEKGVTSLVLTLGLEGGFVGTQNFLAMLENLPYEIEINNFSSRTRNNDEGSVTWFSTLVFSVTTT